jgi:hypothetical protein
MKLKATCAATVPTGEGLWVLLKFDPPNNHFIGEIAGEHGKLEQGKVYNLTIEEDLNSPGTPRA